MSLNIGRALQEGIARTLSRAGLLLTVAWFVLGLLNQLAYNSAIAGVLPDVPNQPMATLGPTLPLSPTAAGAVVFVLYLGSFVVVAAALRTFVTGETGTVPGEYVTRNLGWMLVNYFVGYLVFAVALWVGFLLLVVPGLILLVSLYFWYVLVAVEDQNFVEAFRNSWSLSVGNRWQLLGLGLIVMVVGSVFYGVLFLLDSVLSPWITLVAFSVVLAVFGVFSAATTARAYVQLAEDDASGESAAIA